MVDTPMIKLIQCNIWILHSDSGMLQGGWILDETQRRWDWKSSRCKQRLAAVRADQR